MMNNKSMHWKSSLWKLDRWKSGIVILIISIVVFTRCVSPPNNTIDFAEMYLLQDMSPFSITNPVENSQLRLLYFESYFNTIPRINIYTGTFLSAGNILTAHMIEGEKTDKGTLIMVHGYNGTVLNRHFQYFAQYFIPLGYRVILLNLPGHGFSGGIRGDIDDFASYGAMLNDFFMLTKDQLGENIILIGHSTGAISIYEAYIQYQNSMKQVDVAVLIAPFKDLKFSALYKMGAVFVPTVKVKQKSMLELHTVPSVWIQKEKAWSRKIKTYPTLDDINKMLLVFGKQDTVITNKKSIRFFKEKITNKDIHIYPKQNHTFSNDGYALFREETILWIVKQLEMLDTEKTVRND